jgi:ABC-2 type transport system permease protein
MKAIWKREMQNYFKTPIGYVFVGIFLLLGGFFFFMYNLYQASADLQNMFSYLSYLFLLVVPLLTMKLLSEERRTKTDQLLLTSPASIWSIVVGKFLAACCVLLLSLVCTLFYVIIIAAYATPYVGLIVSNYLGFLMMGCSYIAIGLLMSALTENQLVAAVATLGVNLALQVLEAIGPSLTVPFLTFLPRVFSWISLQSRYYAFSSGIISVADLIYYASFCGILLFLTVRVIDKRRWSES